jgi:hypothetical protein
MVRCPTCDLDFETLGEIILHGLKHHLVSVSPIDDKDKRDD